MPAAGDPAFAQVTITVDRTPPAAPDGSKITAVSDETTAQVQGAAGAVEGSLRVEAVNLATAAAPAAGNAFGNGSFGLSIPAAPGHTLALTVLDAAGNRSAVTSVPVTLRPRERSADACSSRTARRASPEPRSRSPVRSPATCFPARTALSSSHACRSAPTRWKREWAGAPAPS